MEGLKSLEGKKISAILFYYDREQLRMSVPMIASRLESIQTLEAYTL